MSQLVPSLQGILAKRHGFDKASLFLEMPRDDLLNEVSRIPAVLGCRPCQLGL